LPPDHSFATTVAVLTCRGYDEPRNAPQQWVLLAYRLPREPSTPRSTLWRKLRRLGALQLLDGLVGLPLDSRNREQLEWLADEGLAAGGAASTWLAEPLSRAHERERVGQLTRAIAAEYRDGTVEAHTARGEDTGIQRRTVARLRRELRRIGQRDYFPPPERHEARQAVEALARTMEVTP